MKRIDDLRIRSAEYVKARRRALEMLSDTLSKGKTLTSKEMSQVKELLGERKSNNFDTKRFIKTIPELQSKDDLEMIAKVLDALSYIKTNSKFSENWPPSLVDLLSMNKGEDSQKGEPLEEGKTLEEGGPK